MDAVAAGRGEEAERGLRKALWAIQPPHGDRIILPTDDELIQFRDTVPPDPDWVIEGLEPGDVRQAIPTHGYALARAVFGRADGKAYRRLGVTKTPSPGPQISALDRLQGVTIAGSSHWIDAQGHTVTVGESFHLIDFVAWKVVDGKDQIFIGISPAILEELTRGSIATFQRPLCTPCPSKGPLAAWRPLC